MSEQKWIPVEEHLPDDGAVVETKIHDSKGARNEQPLKRRGNLWFVEDDSMYVYYWPTHWRPADQQARADRLKERLRRMDEVRADVQAELDSIKRRPATGPQS